jgi:predicted alpha/beta superfamily hydrolase
LRYQLVRTPGAVPEAGFRGQPVPSRVIEDLEGPLWLFPVTWQDRSGEGRRVTKPSQERNFTVDGRWVRVRLPEAAEKHPELRFPTVLALDGQNLFDPASAYGGVDWALDRVTQQLERSAGLPVVVVGVDHAGVQRLHEYSCCNDVGERAGGGAAEHLDWIVSQVMPVVRHRFPVSERAPVLIGSSLGGHFGLFAAQARPEAFSGIAAMSPSITWGQDGLLRVPPHQGIRPRVWMDMGTQESQVATWAMQAVKRRLKKQGWSEGDDLQCHLIPGAAHHESAWSARLAVALKFLLEPSQTLSLL